MAIDIHLNFCLIQISRLPVHVCCFVYELWKLLQYWLRHLIKLGNCVLLPFCADIWTSHFGTNFQKLTSMPRRITTYNSGERVLYQTYTKTHFHIQVVINHIVRMWKKSHIAAQRGNQAHGWKFMKLSKQKTGWKLEINFILSINIIAFFFFQNEILF